LPVRVFPACAGPRGGGKPQLELCRLLRRFAPGRSACEEFTQAVSKCGARGTRLCKTECFDGVLEIAAKVFNGQEHVATLMAGPVCRAAPRAEAWPGIALRLGELDPGEEQRLRRAYERVPVLDGQRLHAACRLLEFLVRSLEEHLPVWMLANSQPVPLAVLRAKEYLGRHVMEPITLAEVARHAGLGVQRFCTVFKTATGLTFTHFLARLRVQRAKSLLPDISLRIADIAFECGFGSVPTFNRTFKGLVGVAPTEYRRVLSAEAKS
jgi:AraC-like DNA-binding protein